jgi:hypothetical protein
MSASSIVHSGGAAGVGSNGRRDLAAWYLAGAAICAMAAISVGGWARLLLWPAAALAAVAFAYAIGWAGLFGKRNGRLPVWSRVAFGPFLCGQRLSWWIQSRGRTPCSQLLPQLWIGQFPLAQDCAELMRRGVTATIDLTAEFSESRSLRGEGYHNLPMLDLTLPDLETLRRAVAMIDDATRDGEMVYLHCALGYGRTAVAAAAYLLSTRRALTVHQAVDAVRTCRPGSVFSPRALALLEQFHAALW